MCNPDGHCYAFDTRGDGYARGEGVATVVLKLLDKALADGDPVHGVIVGSGINQDGRTEGSIMSPSGEAQRILMQEVYAKAGLDPSHTPYVEAHGTVCRMNRYILIHTHHPSECLIIEVLILSFRAPKSATKRRSAPSTRFSARTGIEGRTSTWDQSSPTSDILRPRRVLRV